MFDHKWNERKMSPGVRMGGLAMAVIFLLACPATIQQAGAQCTPQQLSKLLASGGAVDDEFGYSAAVDGNIAVVGSRYHDHTGSNSGAAWLFDTSTGALLFELLPTNGAEGQEFGTAVDIDGSLVIVGAPTTLTFPNSGGSAYIFDANTGIELTELVGSDTSAYDAFGTDVAIDGDRALVGAVGDEDPGSNSGAAYVFDATTYLQLAKLESSDISGGDMFGNAVDLSGDTAIVAAFENDVPFSGAGAVYVFDLTTYTETHKLQASDADFFDQFGGSVAIDGTTIVVGVQANDDNGSSSGSAYIFDAVTGTESAKLLPSDGDSFHFFGYSVDISGTNAVIGAYGVDATAGAVYLFDTTTYTETAKMTADDGVGLDYLGWSVGLSGNTLVTGAREDDDLGLNSGSAYVFDICPGGTGGPTIGASYTCTPNSGTVPFSTVMNAQLDNLYTGQIRRIAGLINVTLANGSYFASWRAGFTNVAAGGSFASNWSQSIPAIGSVIGDNSFQLVAEDVTPPPYNQPPYPAAGDTASAVCVVTGIAP